MEKDESGTLLIKKQIFSSIFLFYFSLWRNDLFLSTQISRWSRFSLNDMIRFLVVDLYADERVFFGLGFNLFKRVVTLIPTHSSLLYKNVYKWINSSTWPRDSLNLKINLQQFIRSERGGMNKWKRSSSCDLRSTRRSLALLQFTRVNIRRFSSLRSQFTWPHESQPLENEKLKVFGSMMITKIEYLELC